ncbi:MAG: DUF255 domain-containing protein [Crocinitomicaceae bacterium]
MKSIVFILSLFVYILGFSIEAVKMKSAAKLLSEDDPVIEWLDFETAMDKNEEERKFIFVDVYTHWCGWCKKMDQSTFKDKSVVAYMNEYFYAVKMDAESKEPIAYKEVLYEYKMYQGGKGYNELAVNLLGGKMSFPTFVVLSKREVKISTIRGFQKPDQLLAQLEKITKKKL